ncbi:MAG: TrmO family methyltransferase domain-containing protein [Geothrix sp.]
MIDFRQVPREERGPLPPVVFTIQPIGIVHVAPRRLARPQKYFVPKGQAALELFRPYFSGLQGLYEGLDLWVITFHPFSGAEPNGRGQGSGFAPGVFATTAIQRPNPIEFLRAKVLTLDPAQGLLHVEGLDADDGAPILDIRPATSPRHRLLRSGEEMSTR